MHLDAWYRRGAVRDFGFLLDQLHVVPGDAQVVRDEQPHVSGARNRDPHCQCPSAVSMSCCSSSSALMSATKCRTSPSWPTRSPVTTSAFPKRVTAVSQ